MLVFRYILTVPSCLHIISLSLSLSLSLSFSLSLFLSFSFSFSLFLRQTKLQSVWDSVGRAGEHWWRVWPLRHPHGEDPGRSAGQALRHQDPSCAHLLQERQPSHIWRSVMCFCLQHLWILYLICWQVFVRYSYRESFFSTVKHIYTYVFILCCDRTTNIHLHAFSLPSYTFLM